MKPNFKSIDQPFSNKINIEKNTYLYFGGTAYLGISKNQDFIDLYIEGIKKFGLNNGTSRTNNIQLGIYDDAEKVAAARYGAEAALITSSGYLAAQLTVKALSKLGRVIYAPATHPSLWLVENQTRNLMSFKAWEMETIEMINSSEEKTWILISNSMNNLLPEIYDFTFVKEIRRDKNIILVVDDSHGIGVNNNGMGAFVNLPKQENTENVVVASMAKALGVDAGIVLASNKTIDKLKSTNTFIGASPSSPAGIYAFIHAEEIYRKALNKLKNNMLMFETALNLTWKHEYGFPVYLLGDINFSERLLQRQILISSFPYPNPSDPPLDRIVLSSWHEKEDIERLITAINF
ncbi:aminotransferase class I/II-fold pyridoxal phosphate-dependent enzyme [Pedobacter sp. ISL-68]|uniref:aminotransferase class I/II-fold pyridoxal phosphate-dependent enzyme n=1 Tax=unclassified Pedobacter TaxID=2628915 RepID=UPI001BE8DE98|nr:MULTISPECIES: aminotransferase class I/II-fold pyridoxal phosphate-dependent enzyme [unclassified Pedobacter]MBT2563241.1 aminotransferase class I/II-fold pyridoxal phosphate-dependent enzyme [Pedobacter sp. ISL-64]MBT2588718.1 aminotransferase class I/II-fold pyridoxal phosphate-dependent enzyme [Pedobacter sp. ISL-68]